MFPALAALALAAAPAPEITGKYVEARTCDVFTGPCFANADTGLTGRNAVLGWQIDTGTFDGVRLDGLQIVAVVAADETLGLEQLTQPKSIVIVDEKASEAQRDALVRFAQKQTQGLLDDVIDVRSSAIDLEICPCEGNACARLEVGKDITIETRCLDLNHDKGCGNEYRYYEPLTLGVKAIPAMAMEHRFSGKDFNLTWSDVNRRGAYVGTFQIQ